MNKELFYDFRFIIFSYVTISVYFSVRVIKLDLLTPQVFYFKLTQFVICVGGDFQLASKFKVIQ